MAGVTNLERYRAEHDDPSSARRIELLDAAEELFLERGISDTTMMDIAERAGVSRVTVYRYFADRDQVAYEIAARMIEKVAATARTAAAREATPLETARAALATMITEFDRTRDAHRFLAMFDGLRPLRDPAMEQDWSNALTVEALVHVDRPLATQSYDATTTARIVAVGNTVMGVLARYAAGGELLAPQPGLTLDTLLEHLQELVSSYFDTVIAPHATPLEPANAP